MGRRGMDTPFGELVDITEAHLVVPKMFLGFDSGATSIKSFAGHLLVL